MLVNTAWLLDYLEPKCAHAELIDAFTPAGLEVEEAHDLPGDLRDVVIGFVREKNALPDAPGMYHCRIETAKNRVVDVVCASEHEIQVGWGVPVAPPGLKLPTNIKVQAANYHGVRSEGMICLDGELGLIARGTGLQVFEDESLLGSPLADVSDATEYLVELAILPNRPDCLGMIGIAREVAAVLGLTLKYPVAPDAYLPLADESVVPVSIEDPELCPRYLCQVIRGVTVGPSPHWLKSRLLTAGKRPINNVVDVTNFVLLEWGQPLHAFDMASLKGPEIQVRRMKPGESLELLDETLVDGETRPLVIADAERPVALAGIMGGSVTQTGDSTRDVLLEAACFGAVNIRSTSRQLGVRSDSSYRFERGTDPDRMLIGAATRAAELIVELAAGRLDGNCTQQYPAPQPPRKFALSPERFSRYLGMPIDAKTIRENLEKLDVSCDDALNVSVPTWRMDATDPVALIEDVARLVGYDKVPLKPTSESQTSGHTHSLDRLRLHVADALSADGFLECRTPPLRPVDTVGRFVNSSRNGDSAIRLQNPMMADMTELRRSLVPSLLEVVERNARRGAESFRFYEVDRTFFPGKDGPVENWCVGIAMGGPTNNRTWKDAGDPVGFHHLKGVVENLCELAGTPPLDLKTVSAPGFVDGKTGDIVVGSNRLGILGEVDPSLLAKGKLSVPIFAAELNLGNLVEHFADIRLHAPLPRTPAVTRDLAFILAVETPFADVETTARRAFETAARSVHAEYLKSTDAEQAEDARSPRLEQFRCVDFYRGKPIPADRKSLAVRLTFRDPGRTLTSDESTRLTDAVVQALTKRHNAELRG
ncbi:MAG: phenylalanine--tRNA ligase subunit beta [Planctomycetaceae bacterium]